ncbi:tetratricopeptide repeat protein [Pseudomonas sp. S75]|uniref:tetratricopeptide repeat protein n=1 Tax=unclassified Pseudomonas TaxID=196821 RepID=UPI001902E318|nr:MULTISPECIES: tetratricopeptide repeat protein [unclassified Pseudomonas]MBJ9975071.1 tetratricopeptide repeat protein [Pseudomonas sp. S30]MBK0152908.1 tetratricopeptide repeat protein [Pseudomonas sp. S75]
MPHDYLGNPLDSDQPDALQGLNDFIGGFIGYHPRAEAILATADRHPDSALSNALAGILLMFSESPQGPALAQRYRQRAAQVGTPHPRAALYLALLDAWIGDDLDQVLALSERLLTDYPRDLFAAKLNQYVEFNRGNWPALLRIALKTVDAAPDIAQSHAMLAFAYEQCHLLADAERSARQALALQPDEPWAQHALAHVMLSEGRIEEGIDFLHSVSTHWEGLNSFMYTHNWWHLALFLLARGEDQRVLEIYDRHVWGILPQYSQDQIGAVSLLARLEFAGIDVGPRWQALAPWLQQRHADTVQPFLSLQYLYGLARAGKVEADRLFAALVDRSRQAPEFSREVWAEVTLPLAEGLLAHARGEHRRAARLLAASLPRLNEIGGSHAQRDLFAQVEVDARLRSGEWEMAQQTLELRRRYDELDVPSNRHLQRVYRELGLPALAEQARQRVEQVLSAGLGQRAHPGQ